MTIRHWPAAERPREKLLERGVGALSDAELLALFLGAGRRGESAVDAGRRLLLRDGGIKPLLDALGVAPRRRGIGAAATARLLAALELARRCFASELERPQALADPRACARYLQACLGGHPHEVFACLFLDNRHRPIAFEELFRGSIAGTSVHPREVVRRCLAHNAAAVVLAHNHPSGAAEPSQADRDITARLVEALALVDVRVLDHFVVGSGSPTSFAERGLL